MTEEVAGRAVIGRLSKEAGEKVILTSHQWLISLGVGGWGGVEGVIRSCLLAVRSLSSTLY